MVRGFAEAERRYLEDDREEARYVQCTCCGEELYEGFEATRDDEGNWYCDIDCAKNHNGVQIHMANKNMTCDVCHDSIDYGEVIYTMDNEVCHYNIDCLRDLLQLTTMEVEV